MELRSSEKLSYEDEELMETYKDLMLYGFAVQQLTNTGTRRVDPRDVIIGLKEQVVDFD